MKLKNSHYFNTRRGGSDRLCTKSISTICLKDYVKHWYIKWHVTMQGKFILLQTHEAIGSMVLMIKNSKCFILLEWYINNPLENKRIEIDKHQPCCGIQRWSIIVCKCQVWATINYSLLFCSRACVHYSLVAVSCLFSHN